MRALWRPHPYFGLLLFRDLLILPEIELFKMDLMFWQAQLKELLLEGLDHG
jgi:hypothetical protein